MKKQWQAATAVIETLEQAGYEAVFVGGAVRDLLLNRPFHDIDIATSAEPLEMKQVFEKTVDVGIAHGTLLILDAGEPIEVTTFRTDGEYTDHRRPDSVQFVRSLEEDLQRRDFTVNAMALRKDHSLVDFFEGQKDLANKVIRAVGEPAARFEEDALRMLRAVRFAAQLGFTIEEQTLEAIRQLAAQIQYVAQERVTMELDKLWTSPYVYKGLKMLKESGLSAYLPGQGNIETEKFKVFQTSDPNVGWAYFIYLQQEPALIAQYRLSNKSKRFINEAMTAADRLQHGWQASDYFRFSLEALQTAYDFEMWQGHSLPFSRETIAQQKAQLPLQTKQDLSVTGHDFIEWHGGKKGPWLSVAIESAIQAILEGSLRNERDEIKEWFLHDFNQT